METVKLLSGYAKTALPFLAAVLSGLNAYEARKKPWRCASSIVIVLLFIAYGCYLISRPVG